jgi:hypothetical protein
MPNPAKISVVGSRASTATRETWAWVEVAKLKGIKVAIVANQYRFIGLLMVLLNSWKSVGNQVGNWESFYVSPIVFPRVTNEPGV